MSSTLVTLNTTTDNQDGEPSIESRDVVPDLNTKRQDENAICRDVWSKLGFAIEAHDVSVSGLPFITESNNDTTPNFGGSHNTSIVRSFLSVLLPLSLEIRTNNDKIKEATHSNISTTSEEDDYEVLLRSLQRCHSMAYSNETILHAYSFAATTTAGNNSMYSWMIALERKPLTNEE